MRRMVEGAADMQPHDSPLPPRHRGNPSAQVEPPRSPTTPPATPTEIPAPFRNLDSSTGDSLDPGSIVFSPDPGRYQRHGGDPADHGIGFRSTREVTAEMSPVIYRPAGSGGDREPERPPRVSIAGPGVPTAASFTQNATPSKNPPPESPPTSHTSRTNDDLDDDLDDDPEIDEDELVGEAEDTLLDDVDKLDDAGKDDLLPDARVAPPARRGPLQRRRRRLLGRSDNTPEPEPTPEPRWSLQPELAPTEPHPAEPLPTAPPPPAAVAPEPEAPGPEVAEHVNPPATTAEPAAAPRPRRVRTLHIGAPPIGPANEQTPEPSLSDDSVAEPVIESPPADEPPVDDTVVDDTVVDGAVVDGAVVDGAVVEDSVVETSVDETPLEDPVDEAAAEAPPAVPDPRWRQAAPPRFGSPVPRIPAPEPEAAEQAEATVEPEAPADDPAGHERESAAISGHVISTRGRGLSGVAMVAIDSDGQVVGTATTGRRGEFIVENLSAGTYRIGARDTVDGDFIDSWHGGDDPHAATELQAEDDLTIRDIDITLIGRVAIDVAVDVRRKKVVVDVEVIDRSTGLPAEGTIIIGTDQFRTRLPLTNGRTNITLFGSNPDGELDAERLDPRVSIEYAGAQHTAGASRTIRLR